VSLRLFGINVSVRREKLGFEGGQLAAGGPVGQHTRFNIEKHEQSKSTENMNKHTHATSHDTGQLAEDARALMAATADVAGEKVVEARKRLADALESAKEIVGRVRNKTIECAKAADEAVHEHPYKAIAIGAGVGALIGFIVARRCSRNGD
jgi:ElaB/YqjD/DUF883 family membrane-anchored ribosome-binding protein